MIKQCKRFILITIIAVLLSACGQSGKLYLPEHSPQVPENI